MHRRLIILLICLIFADYTVANTSIMADTHIYKGRYTNSSDILYTWDGKHIYKGRYTNSSDILFTYDGKHLYRGRYTNSSDIILTYGGPVPVPFLMTGVL